MQRQCRLCKNRTRNDAAGGGLCKYHSEARTALKRGYKVWNEAFSGLEWKDYLNRVKTAEGTGEWVKEVIGMEEERTAREGTMIKG